MAGPFARILAQVVIVAGGAVVRSIVNAYKEAAARGASNPAASSVKQAISRRMNPEEAAKILDIELNQATREKLAQRFETLYKANAPTADFPGSPYIQRKVGNANTVLNDYLNRMSASKKE
jgi:hypothetical protein